MNCGANACAGTGGAPTELTDIPARAHTNDTLRGSELTDIPARAHTNDTLRGSELTDIPARAHTNDTLRGSELTDILPAHTLMTLCEALN